MAAHDLLNVYLAVSVVHSAADVGQQIRKEDRPYRTTLAGYPHIDVLGAVWELIDLGFEIQAPAQGQRLPGGAKLRSKRRFQLVVEQDVAASDADTDAVTAARSRLRPAPGKKFPALVPAAKVAEFEIVRKDL